MALEMMMWGEDKRLRPCLASKSPPGGKGEAFFCCESDGVEGDLEAGAG